MPYDYTKGRHISRQQNKWLNVSANHDVTWSESLAVDASGGSVTLTLPASPGVGQWVEVWLTAGDEVTLSGNGNTLTGQQVQGAGTYVFNHRESVLTVMWDGSTWRAQSTADTSAQKYFQRSADFQAFPGTSYQVDVSANPVTVTLPESPNVPDIFIQHTEGDITVNSITIMASGTNTIGNLAQGETVIWDEFSGGFLRLHWSGLTWELSLE